MEKQDIWKPRRMHKPGPPELGSCSYGRVNEEWRSQLKRLIVSGSITPGSEWRKILHPSIDCTWKHKVALLNEANEVGREERKALHGGAYVERFEREQSVKRISRLVPMMGLTGTEKIVDIGCGNAMSLSVLYGCFGSYSGVDFSEPFIEAAQERARTLAIENTEFFCGSAESYAENHANRFDVALALDISEHVYDEEWQLILRAIYKLLKTGGKLFVHTPNLDFFIERLKARNIVLKQFPQHVAVRTMEQNVQLMQKAGFRIRVARALPHYNRLAILHPLSHLPQIGKYFEARLFIEAEKPV